MQEAAGSRIESQERIAQIGKLMQTEKGRSLRRSSTERPALYVLDYWKARARFRRPQGAPRVSTSAPPPTS